MSGQIALSKPTRTTGEAEALHAIPALDLMMEYLTVSSTQSLNISCLITPQQQQQEQHIL
jgi:hypothetical protein